MNVVVFDDPEQVAHAALILFSGNRRGQGETVFASIKGRHDS
jgi:hypothetical protein